MTIDEILKDTDKKRVIERLCRDTIDNRNTTDYVAEYNGGRDRRATSVSKRETKTVDVFSETETDDDGNPLKTGTKPIFPAKIHTNMPKRIVRTAAAFLFGGEMAVAFAEENEAGQFFKELVTDRLKLKSVLNMFARTVMTETKSAILFYPSPSLTDGKQATEIRIRILNHKNGVTTHPLNNLLEV